MTTLTEAEVKPENQRIYVKPENQYRLSGRELVSRAQDPNFDQHLAGEVERGSHLKELIEQYSPKKV